MNRTAVIGALAALCAFPGFLAALPDEEKSSCTAFVDEGAETSSELYRPLEPEQRLWYGISDLEDQNLEIRYLVENQLYAVEKVDLSSATLSRREDVAVIDDMEMGYWIDEGATPALELLTVHPQLVRQLHYAVDLGVRVDVEIEGQHVSEFVSFGELVRRSGELRQGSMLPLVVHPSVEVLGDLEEMTAVESFGGCLPVCGGACGSNVPCDTPCSPYFVPPESPCPPPTTCGQQGRPCEPTPPPNCACQSSFDYWSPWYRWAVQPVSPGTFACRQPVPCTGPSYTFRNFYYVERRDRIRRTTVCPNCPQCVGCTSSEQIINYQTRVTSQVCWAPVGACGTGAPCGPPVPLCTD